MRRHKGKITGSLAGLVGAGFWGAFFGFLAGLAFDEWKTFLQHLHTRPLPAPTPVAYETTAVLALVPLARLAGLPALQSSGAALDILKSCFVMDARSLRYMGKVLSTPLQSDAHHVESLLGTLRQAFVAVPGLRDRVLACLSRLAERPDGRLDSAARHFLADMGGRLGLAPADVEKYLGACSMEGQDPYALLGLSTLASQEEITTTYKRLISETHPDRLRARLSGLALAQAEARARDINAAYDSIRQRRGM